MQLAVNLWHYENENYEGRHIWSPGIIFYMYVISFWVIVFFNDIITTVGFATICDQGSQEKALQKDITITCTWERLCLSGRMNKLLERLNGTFLYNNPSLYRHNKKAGMKNISSSMYSNTPRGLGTATSNSVVHEGMNRYANRYQSTKTYGSSGGIYPDYNPALQS